MHPYNMHVIEAEDPVGELGHGFQVPVQCGGVQEDGCLPRGLLHGLGNAARHIPGSFVELGVVLHYQEGVVILLQDGHDLERGEASSHLQLRKRAMELAQDAGEITRYVEDLESLQVWVAIEHVYEGLPGCYQDVEGSGLEGYCRVELEVHNAYPA